MLRGLGKYRFFLAAAGIQVFSNIIWLGLDNTPPAWDQAAHIRSTILANQFFRGEFGGGWVDLIRSFGGYPPLIYIMGGWWSLFAGKSIGGITFLNTVFLLSALAGVYKLTLAVYGDKRIATGAMAIFGFMPVVYDISRNFLLDLPLLAFVVWGMYFWVSSDQLRSTKKMIGLAVMMVMASLTKLNGFLYFGPMVLGSAWQVWRSKDKKGWRNLMLWGLIYLLAVSGWWLVNFENIYGYLTGLAGQGEPMTDPMILTSGWTWLHYFKLFFLHQLSPIPTLIFLISAYFWKKDKKLLMFLAINYVGLTVIKNKDFRFTLPLLPVAAIVMSQGLGEIRQRNKLAFKVLAGMLSVFLIFHFWANSFEGIVKKPWVVGVDTFVFGGVEIVGVDDYPVRSAKQGEWPNKQIISDLGRLAIERGKKIRVLVLINLEEINDNNLAMYREMSGVNLFDLGSVGSRIKFDSEEEIRELLGDFEAYLVPESSFDPAPFYGVNLQAYKQARDFILENRGEYELKESYGIYQDKELYLFIDPE